MNEAELLFSEVLGLSRAGLYLNRALALEKNKSREIAAVLKRRIKGEPLPYILGKAGFMGLDFKVTPDVLIPRQETEILVEEALRIAQGIDGSNLRILDLGTGSGCIAITLAKFLPQAGIDAVDISQEALEVARCNAARHNVRINFIKGNLFDNNICRPSGYDLILANPPYVSGAEIAGLAPEVQQEPRLALDGGNDGLDFYRRIAGEAAVYLKENGYLILEVGFGQAGGVSNIFTQRHDLRIIKVTADYQGIDRVIVMQRKA